MMKTERVAARSDGEALGAQLTAVSAELAAARAELDALKAQLAAVGAELAAARADTKPLHDQLAAVGAELIETRAQRAALEGRLARLTAAASDPAPAGGDDGALAWQPETYGAAIAQLAAALKQQPQNAALRRRLARAHLLQPTGGAFVFDRIGDRIASLFDPDAALRLLAETPVADAQDAALLRAARRLATPPIVIAALPKSGSVFMMAALRDGFGKPGNIPSFGGQFPGQRVARGGFGHALRLRAVVHSHVSASRGNLIDLFEHFRLERLVVQVRDPRQALISWFHYMPSIIAGADPSLAQHWQVPQDYGAWSRERQLDWCIDGWYRSEIEWMMQWLEAAARPELSNRILFTQFEDMVTDQPAYFARILEFYGIPPALFDPPAPPKVAGEFNFRRGRIDEWRETMTAAQIARVSAALPDALSDRFGWQRQ